MGVTAPPDPPAGTPSPPPPRPPRPGDPFATASAVPAPPPRRRRRKGRTFFLILLFVGGILALGSIILFLVGRGMILDFYRDVVLPRGIPEALPPDYPRAEAVRLVQTLDAFFKRADAGGVDDERVLEVISGIEAAMADRRITAEEAARLIDLAGPAASAGAADGEG